MTPLQHKGVSPNVMSETSIRIGRITRVILFTAKYQLLQSIIFLDNMSLLHFFCENNNISNFCVVLLCIFTFLVSCCDFDYDFHIKQCSVRLYLQCLQENKGNNKITELQTILQRESQNSLVYKQTKSVNNRKTVKTVMTLTWYRHF